MSAVDPLSHPENDLRDDRDFSNVPRPQPHSFDELADAPDPKRIAHLNRQSSRQAVVFTVTIIVLSFAVAFALLFYFRLMGGPLCTEGPNTWLCSAKQQLTFAIGASIIPLCGMFGSGIIMVRKLRSYLRWRTWMGAFWVLTPHCMFWMLQTLLQLSNALS
ncbi:MAG: hypothetical protein SOW59_08950 [Corynebacterium sp.]|nr:hypothetical protein [Corynebacterium sp.]